MRGPETLVCLIVSLVFFTGEVYAQEIGGGGNKIANLTVNVDGIPEPVYRIGGDVRVPQLIFTPLPLDPRPTEVSGTVVVSLIVTSKGDIENIKVLSPLSSEQEARAIEAARKYKFKPSTKNGKPVSVRVMVEVNFGP